jgi:hypothetical protein
MCRVLGELACYQGGKVRGAWPFITARRFSAAVWLRSLIFCVGAQGSGGLRIGREKRLDREL